MQTTASSTSSLHPLGEPRLWALHFALVGGASGYLAPELVSEGFLPSGYVLTTGVSGALVGGALGALLPMLILRLGQIPLGLLLLIGPAVGATWGGLTGAFGGAQLIVTHHMLSLDLAVLSVVVAAAAGALQFGWLWLPYTFLQTRRKSPSMALWGLVVVAMAMPWVGHCVLVRGVFPLLLAI